MNILEQEDIIKGLPDAALVKEASAPSGQVPQFLVISEIKRRSDMRKRYQEQQQQPQGTVKDQIVMEAMGIAPMMPTAMTPPAQPMGPAGPPPNGAMPPPMGGMSPQGAPPMASPMPQGMPPMPQGGIASAPPAMPPMGMAQGGIVHMDKGGALPAGQFRLFDGSTIADKMAELLDRVRRGELAYADVLANISSLPASDARDMALSYVQSEVGGKRTPASASRPRMEEGMFGYSDRDARIMGTMESPLPNRESYPAGRQGRELFEREFMDTLNANDAIFYGARDGGRGLAQAPTPLDEEQMRVAESQLDALDGMPVTPTDRSFKGITLSETKPKPEVRPASQIYADSSLKRGIEALGGAISDEFSATPLAQFDRDASQRIREVMEKDGIGAAVGQFGREAVASVMPAARTVVEGGIAPILGAVGEGVAYVADTPVISEPARALDQLITGSVDDPLTVSQIFGGKDDAAVQGASPAQVQANGMLPEYTDYTTLTDQKGKLLFPAVVADEVAAKSPFSLEFLERQNAIAAAKDAARKDSASLAGRTVDTKGESTPETRLTDAVAELPRNDRSTPEMPTLDFSDLIADSKKQALANAMIQLGAGVASGDVAKGLSAAGTAAMKGTADARALDMKRRLAEYQAGREDIRRGEEADRFERQMRLQERKVDISASQFKQTLDQASDKLDADIAKAGRVSKGQLLTFVADIVQESLRNYVPKDGESMEDVAAELSDQLLRKYAGFMDVDVSGLPAITGGTQTGSRSREDILAQYNVAN